MLLVHKRWIIAGTNKKRCNFLSSHLWWHTTPSTYCTPVARASNGGAKILQSASSPQKVGGRLPKMVPVCAQCSNLQQLCVTRVYICAFDSFQEVPITRSKFFSNLWKSDFAFEFWRQKSIFVFFTLKKIISFRTMI